MSITAAQIASQLNGQVIGDGSVAISGLAPADCARAGELTFAENAKYFAAAERSQAAAILVSEPFVSGSKVLIDTTSIWADNNRLTGHLKSPDFFDVAQFPTATFETLSITPQATNSLVTGNLTLHGVTKQISFPASIQIASDSLDLIANFVLNRFDFDIKYAGKADDLIRRDVVLKLKIKATKKA